MATGLGVIDVDAGEDEVINVRVELLGGQGLFTLSGLLLPFMPPSMPACPLSHTPRK